MEITKNGHTFYVTGDFSYNFFKNNKLDRWEQETFHILENYKNENKTYIDIGAWIGPTVLYSANIFKKVIAIEPDPVAMKRLEENIKINKYNNIILINKCISNENKQLKFGGNGPLGNSESTMLICDNDYFSYNGRHTDFWKNQQNDILTVEGITLEKLLDEQNINANDIALIKIDIEGGEKIIIPQLKTYLKKYKPPLYISLHYCYLKQDDIINILNVLFDTYLECHYYDYKGNIIVVDINIIIKYQLQTLLFK